LTQEEREMVRRSPLDAEAKLLQEQIENKRRAKARARIAKMLAKRAGHTTRMPLTGKAALRAIKVGRW
jgi:hypothetical protein